MLAFIQVSLLPLILLATDNRTKRLLNVKHPKAIGRPYRATWPEVYAIPETAKVLDEVWARCANGVATKQENVTYFLLHESRLEEHIFHLNMMPFFGANGETVGIVQIIDEITQEQVRNRRLATLISMADLTAGEEELGAFFARVIEALKSNSTHWPTPSYSPVVLSLYSLRYSIRYTILNWPLRGRRSC